MTHLHIAAPTTFVHVAANVFRPFASAGQYILNSITEAAQRAADRERFAALPQYLRDDVGMTFEELDAAARKASARPGRHRSPQRPSARMRMV